MVSEETWHWWMNIKNGVMTTSDDVCKYQKEALYLALKDELVKLKNDLPSQISYEDRWK